MFDLSYNDYYNLDNLKIANGSIDKEKLQSILKLDGFIFPTISV